MKVKGRAALGLAGIALALVLAAAATAATIVGTPGNDALRGTMSADEIRALDGDDFVNARAGDDVGTLGQRQHAPEVVDVELAVGVGEGDEVEPGRLEAGAQRRPVAAVALVAEQADVRPACRLVGGDQGGGISAAVVDDEDLMVVTQAGEGVVGLGDGLAETGLFVIGG